MPARMLQFHAEPRELVFGLLPRWLGEMQKFLMVQWEYNASGLIGLPAFAYPDHLPRDLPVADVLRVAVSDRPWVEGGETLTEVLDVNPGFKMSLVIGGEHHGGIQQSIMSGSLSHAFKAADSDLLAGAVLVQRRSGRRYPDPKYRYSPGALDLSRRGIPIWATDYRGNQYDLGVMD